MFKSCSINDGGYPANGRNFRTLVWPCRHRSSSLLQTVVLLVFLAILFVVYAYYPEYLNSLPQMHSQGRQGQSAGREGIKSPVSCRHPSSSLLKYVAYNATELEEKSLRIMNRTMWNCIKPTMTSAERLTVHWLLKEFVKICHLFNITDYFLFSGSLLGSYRHHGLQPWDDDIDILMRYSDQVKILDAFNEYTNQSDDVIAMFMYTRLKLFHKNNSILIQPYGHRWPFLDMSFYHENETHIWEIYLDGATKYHIVEKSLIFPLHLRPFEAVMISSPKDAYAVLKLLFNDYACVPLTWIHKSESFPPHRLDHFECEIVASIYPFVHRKAVGGCIEESLWVNESQLYTVLIAEPTYAVTKPYRLELVEPSSSNRPMRD